MAKVILGLAKLSIALKKLLGRRVEKALTNNPNFPNISPTAADAKIVTDDLEAADIEVVTAEQGFKKKLADRDTAEKAFDSLMKQLGLEVEKVSNGDLAKITSAGMNVKSVAAKIGELPAPSNLRAVPGKIERTIELRWKPVKNAVNYVVMVSDTGALDGTGDWKQAAITTKANIVCNSFASGSRHWFRVAPMGAAGQGPWSDPATSIAS